MLEPNSKLLRGPLAIGRLHATSRSGATRNYPLVLEQLLRTEVRYHPQTGPNQRLCICGKQAGDAW